MSLELIKWTHDLATGIDWQDKDHRALLNYLLKLHQAIEERKAGREVVKTLDFLDQFVKIHFSREEKYMQDFAYPEIKRHKKEHKYFINRLNKLRGMITHTRKLILAVRLHQDLSSWVVNHIKVSDKKLGRFLQS